MPVWKKTINIKSILHKDQENRTDEHAAYVAQEIAKLIRKKAPSEWLHWTEGTGDEFDETLLTIVGELEDLRPDTFSKDGRSDKVCDALNDLLSELYNWADEKRVWLGL